MIPLAAWTLAFAFQPHTEVVDLERPPTGPAWVFDRFVYLHFGDRETLNSFDVDTWEHHVLEAKGEVDYSPVFVGDLGSSGAGPFCGDGLDTIHCLDRNLVLEDDWVRWASDIDGDGDLDLVGWKGHHLDRGDHLASFEYPTSDTAPYRSYPVGDIDGDGATDFILVTFTEPEWRFYLYTYHSSALSLHRGTATGYEAEPTWTIDVGGPVDALLDIQADDDPEREIVLVLGDDVADDSYVAVDLRLATVDPSGPTPELWVSDQVYFPLTGSVAGESGASLHEIGDVDGDGVDEVLLVSAVRTSTPATLDSTDYFRILTATNGWDLYAPLKTLTPWRGEGAFTDLRVTTADVDLDGRIDVVATRENHSADTVGNIDPPEIPATLQVWYAPWLEPDPVLPHTGDTATRPTGATADTGSPTTGETPGTTTPSNPTDPSGCGCQTTTIRTPWFPFARRRAGATP